VIRRFSSTSSRLLLNPLLEKINGASDGRFSRHLDGKDGTRE